MKLEQVIRRLERKLSVVIDLEVLHPAFVEQPELTLAPDQYYHHGEYCHWCKFRPGGLAVCSANKQRSKEIAAFGRPFHGCCPNGVWDYARPVRFEGRTACILYFGYRTAGKNWNPRFQGRIPAMVTPELLDSIRHCSEWLSILIELELEEWRDSAARPGRKRDDAYYLEQCLRFIERSYHRNPALADLAEILHVNANYLGETIVRAAGKTFRELLTERRMREAEQLFKFQPRLHRIGEVGRLCGFNDSNYFCTVFRKHFGIPPREYIRRFSVGR